MMLIYADKTTIQTLVVASGFTTTGAGSQIILLIDMLPQEKLVSVKILKQKCLKQDIKNIEISQQILTAS